MTASDLSALIQAGESETVEFKQSTGGTREIGETGCAFANARGGTILIGPAGGKLHVATGNIGDRIDREQR